MSDTAAPNVRKRVYRPCDLATDAPMPYGGSSPEWRYGRESSAAVLADSGDGVWGFYDPDWKDPETNRVRGRLQINVTSTSGHGGTGADGQTQVIWAPADDPVAIMDRIALAIRFTREETLRGIGSE